jgi:hypothetical protein
MASIVSLGVAFFFPALSHVPLLFPMTILILFWIGMRDYKAQPPDGLSTASLALFTRYPQYYAHPFMGSQCSGAASFFMMTLIPLTIIACAKGFWWSVLISGVLVVIVAPLQRFFNPTQFFTSDWERDAHNQLIEALRSPPAQSMDRRSPSNTVVRPRAFTVHFPGGAPSGWVSGEQVIQFFLDGRIDATSWVYPSDTREWVHLGSLFKLPSRQRLGPAKPLGPATNAATRSNPSLATKLRQVSSELKGLEDYELMSELRSGKLGSGAQTEVLRELANRGIKVPG